MQKGKLSMIAAYMIVLAKNLNAVLVTSDEIIQNSSVPGPPRNVFPPVVMTPFASSFAEPPFVLGVG